MHRIGRTGRAGRDGKAMMICVPRDEKNLDAIERLIEKEIPRGDNPLAASGATAAEAAPETETPQDEKPRRSRSRGRSRTQDPAPAEPVKAET